MDLQGSQAQHFVESTITAEGGGGWGGGRGYFWTLGVGTAGASAVTLSGHWSPGRDIPSSSVSIPWDGDRSHGTQGSLLSALGSLLCNPQFLCSSPASAPYFGCPSAM